MAGAARRMVSEDVWVEVECLEECDTATTCDFIDACRAPTCI